MLTIINLIIQYKNKKKTKINPSKKKNKTNKNFQILNINNFLKN